MVTARRDFFTSLVLIVFGLAVTFESWRMPRFESIGGSLATAPGLVPGLLGLVITLFGIVMLVRSVRAGAFAGRAGEEQAPEGGGRESFRRLLLMLVLSIGYAGVLVGRIPFSLATFLYVFTAVGIFDWRPEDPPPVKARRLGIAFVEALAVAVAVTFVFEQIFLVTLP